MSLQKKIFIGSLFEFTKPSEAIKLLQDRLPKSGPSPFITYDDRTKIFSFEAGQSCNESQVLDVVRQLATYIESNRTAEPDLTSSPRLKPISGTVFHEQSSLAGQHNIDLEYLLDYESGDEYEEPTIPSVESHTSRWIPQEGDISIVTQDIANTIANHTGCSLFAEPSEKRIRLVNGDTEKALCMLQNLEGMMSLIARHRIPAESRLNANILFLRSRGTKGAIKFVKLLEPHAGIDRIILPTPLEALIERLLIVEVRTRHNDVDEYRKPFNLDLHPDLVEPVSSIAACSVFAGISTTSIGSDQNRVPMDSSTNPPDGAASVQQTSLQTKFMAPNKATRVAEWTHNVDMLAAPDLAPQQPRSDEILTSRRRVVEESESESDSTDTEKERQSGKKSQNPAMETSATSSSTETLSLLKTADSSKHSNSSIIKELQKEQFDLQRDPLERSIKTPIKNKFTTANRFDLLDTEGDEVTSETLQEQNEMSCVDLRPNLANGSASAGRDQATYPSKRDSVAADESLSKTEKDITMLACENVQPRELISLPYQVADSIERTHDYDKRNLSDSIEVSNGSAQLPLSNTDKGDRGDDKTCSSKGHIIDHQRKADLHDASGAHALIDLSNSAEVHSQGQPPDGLDYRSATLGSPALNLMDEDLDHLLKPTTKTAVGGAIPYVAPRSSSPEVAGSISRIMNYKPRPFVVKRDMNVLRHQRVAQIQSGMDPATVCTSMSSEKSETPPPIDKPLADPAAPLSNHHEAIPQNVPQRPGKSPGKKSRCSPGIPIESKQEKAARIARAKADAYGDIFLPKPSQKTPESHKMNAESGPSQKQQLTKTNPVFASTHSDSDLEQVIRQRTSEMLPRLSHLFEACRAFAGHVEFEFQLGQALVLQNSSIDDSLLYQSSDWDRLTQASQRTPIESVFTNIITRNGYEIDQLLEMRGTEPQSRLWTKQSISSPDITFEFLCQDKTGGEFTIQMNSIGHHQIFKNRGIIGKIALYFPERVWDACASLHGDTLWNTPPLDIIDGTQEFMQSVYVPPKSKAIVYYRQPKNRAFVVRDVVVRRTSVHGCLMINREDVQLKVSEIKTLLQTTHPTDRSLYRSFEMDDQEMIRGRRVHYEAAVVNNKIAQTLSQHNSSINIGELTTEQSTGKNLIPFDRVFQMIEIINCVIEEIDWLGSTNYGTYRRLIDEVCIARAEIEATLPPHIPTQIGTTMSNFATNSSAALNSALRKSGGASNTEQSENKSTFPLVSDLRPLRGIRVGEKAPLYKQGDQYFRLGLGGARIPVPEADIFGPTTNMSDQIMPGDSASQAGDNASTNLQAKIRYGGRPREPEKPPGFW